MSDILISLDVIEQMIIDQLEHGASALQTQDVRWAKRGLTAAAQAKCLAELVINNVSVQDNQVRRITEIHKQSIKLLASYWEDFGIVLLKRTSTGEHTVVIAEPLDKPSNGVSIRHLGKENPPHRTYSKRGTGRRGRLPEELDIKLRGLIAGGVPSGISKTAWFKQVATDCGVAEATVWNKELRMKERGEI